MKPRRKLEKGERIYFEYFNGHPLSAVVDRQVLQEVYLKDSECFDPIMGNKVGNIASIHRIQVVKTFKKVKKKPLIVWLNKNDIDSFKSSNAVKTWVFTNIVPKLGEIPLRPLTKRERERWGV